MDPEGHINGLGWVDHRAWFGLLLQVRVAVNEAVLEAGLCRAVQPLSVERWRRVMLRMVKIILVLLRIIILYV